MILIYSSYTHKNKQIIQNVINTELTLVYNYCYLNKLLILKKKKHVSFKSSRSSLLKEKMVKASS